MKKCKKCKAVFSDDTFFCTQCGEKLSKYSSGSNIFVGIIKGLAYVVLFFQVQTIVSFIYSFYLGFSYSLGSDGVYTAEALRELMMEKYLSSVSYISIVSYIVTAAILMLYFFARKRSFAESTGLRRCALPSVPVAVIAGIALNYVITIAMALTPIPQEFFDKHNETYSYMGKSNLIVEFIAVALLAPVIEEIIFRGLCYGHMKRVLTAIPAIVLSGVVFGIAHGNPLSFIYTTALGILLAAVYEKTGSLLPSVLIHVGFNAGSYLVSITPFYESFIYFAIMFLSMGAVAAAACAFIIKTPAKQKEQSPDCI